MKICQKSFSKNCIHGESKLLQLHTKSNSIVYSKGSSRNYNIHTYEPIASQSNNRQGRIASLRDNSAWYLDLFDNISTGS